MAGEVRGGTTGGAEVLVDGVVVSVRAGAGGEGAVPAAVVAQPEHDGADDEQGSRRDANDQGPGQARAQVGRGHRVLHLRV